jgi:predicted ATP-grasp superfamily ATP-dependent carboligase
VAAPGPVSSGAIVLGGDVNGIAVIRSLGRLGVRCGALLSPLRADHARHSRYLTCSRVVPADASDSQLTSGIDSVASQLDGAPCVLIPTTDRFSQFLGRNREALAKQYHVCNPAQTLCDTFLDKWQTAELCRSNDLLIPPTFCPSTDAELAEIARDLRYPAIVKPRHTFGTSFPGKNAVIENENDLIGFLAGSALLGHCVIQQVIRSGDGDIIVTATYSGSSGTVEAIYSGRKLRQYLPDYGATCFGISERHLALEEGTRAFLDNIRYQGFAALEFARSRDDGKAYFLELNTRTYYHNQLFADAGVDLTQVAYLSTTGNHDKIKFALRSQREGLIWLDFRRDYQSMRLKRKQGRITAFGWMRSLLSARSFACWNWRDPVPFVAACLRRLKVLTGNFWQRLLR